MSFDFKNQVEDLVSQLSESYKREQYIIPQSLGPLPNKEVVIEISEILRRLIFPGYFEKSNYMEDLREYHIGELLIRVRGKLTEQISFALRHQASSLEDFESEDLEEKSEQLCFQFLETLPKIREYLATDVQAAYDGDPAAGSKDEIIFSYPGVFAVSIHRLAHELQALSVPLIPRIMSEYAHSITGIDIHSGASIGKYFFIDHGTGVVIGETTVIGDHVKIYQGVTLGALSTRGGQNLRGVKRHPTIEADVTVYSGASILGGDTMIGKGAVIGSNAFITKSVPGGTKVSIKNPELVFVNQPAADGKQELTDSKQELIFDWII
ncbi:serine acetyltransferase [Anoxybacterium hadale]|uniref:Serine acetyltransferase n=1 Tax=Anoxybacterium hadale TaxID=3408580 RepID=A0ACD1AF31_9FIRM|nr:serine acetyltransferase [Clostridiales bacterium]